TIMVVDDNVDVTYTVKKGLESLDDKYTVLVAKSGEQCLQLLKDNNIPDAILLDIMMPGISGWETFDRIKASEKWKNIPILFLTARTDDVAERAGGFLADDYIEKPFQIEDLKKRLNQMIKK
ncbi:MAG: response regulator, partial [Candidatus Thermoplasmatota archaeon]